MDSSTAAVQLEAVLFCEGAPVAVPTLLRILNISEAQLESASVELEKRLAGRGIALIRTTTELALAVAPAGQAVVEELYRKELGKEIGDAGLEVLAIVLYGGPATRARIDYIRGVNTSSTIRNLLARGLLERTSNERDGREYIYRPTTELLAHIGILKMTELPDYAKIIGELAAFEALPAPFNEDNHAEDTARAIKD